MEPIKEIVIDSELSSIHWHPFNVNGHNVLDLGCGRWGINILEENSPIWFFNHGAKKVIAVDMDTAEIDYYKNSFSDSNCQFILQKIDSRQSIIDLINTHQITCLKIDIEGDERFLLECESNDVSDITEMAIEFHSNGLKELSFNKMTEWGFKIHTVARFSFGGEGGVWYGSK